MSDIKFTDEQIAEIYELIAGADMDFAKRLAHAAIAQMTDVQCDMYNDHFFGDTAAEPIDAPDENDIRNAAVDYTKDMLAHFKDNLIDSIEQVKFKANIKIKSTMNFDLKFV